MKQFQVPQFITIEDRPFGPFTIKQFVYILIGSLLVVGTRLTLTPLLFWPIAVLIGATAAGLAFLKINGQPLPIILKNAAFYLLRPRLYVWKHEKVSTNQLSEPVGAEKSGSLIKGIPTISQSKLTDLAWSLDIKAKRE